MFREASKNPDDLHGDETVAVIEVRVRRNGAMSVAGDIHDKAFALAMLDHAKDSVKNHHARLEGGKTLITPAYDTPLTQ